MKALFLILLLWSGVAFGAGNCSSYLEGSRDVDIKALWKNQSVQFTKKQVKRWEGAMSHLLEDLEGVDSSQKSSKDFQIKTEWERAVKRMPEVIRAWEQLKPNVAKKHYFKEIYAAIWATLLMHSHEMVDAQKNDKDFGRYLKILREIQSFSSDNAAFSFYRVRRAIEGRYSLKEFVNCL